MYGLQRFLGINNIVEHYTCTNDDEDTACHGLYLHSLILKRPTELTQDVTAQCPYLESYFEIGRCLVFVQTSITE